MNLFGNSGLVDKLEIMELNNRLMEACEKISKHFCEGCGGCCQNPTIHLSEEEANTLVNLTNKREDEMKRKYLEQTDDGFVIPPPCPFLSGDERCKVYDNRPDVCRYYPFRINGVYIVEEGAERYIPVLGITEYCECAETIEREIDEIEREIKRNETEEEKLARETMEVLMGDELEKKAEKMLEKEGEENEKARSEMERVTGTDLGENIGRYKRTSPEVILEPASRIK